VHAGMCLTMSDLPCGRGGDEPSLQLYGPWVRARAPACACELVSKPSMLPPAWLQWLCSYRAHSIFKADFCLALPPARKVFAQISMTLCEYPHALWPVPLGHMQWSWRCSAHSGLHKLAMAAGTWLLQARECGGACFLLPPRVQLAPWCAFVAVCRLHM